MDKLSQLICRIESSVENFISTPVTPIGTSWDEIAGNYVTNGVGNGLFYSLLSWSTVHSLYLRAMNAILSNFHVENQVQRNRLISSLWHFIFYFLSLFATLYYFDPGYIWDLLRLDFFSFCFRAFKNTVKQVPRKMLFIFVITSAFHIHSAIQSLIEDNDRSPIAKLCTVAGYLLCFIFRKLRLMMMLTSSIGVVGMVQEMFRFHYAITTPPQRRPKRAMSPLPQRNSEHGAMNKLYQTIKCIIMLRKTLNRRASRIHSAGPSTRKPSGEEVIISEMSLE